MEFVTYDANQTLFVEGVKMTLKKMKQEHCICSYISLHNEPKKKYKKNVLIEKCEICMFSDAVEDILRHKGFKELVNFLEEGKTIVRTVNGKRVVQSFDKEMRSLKYKKTRRENKEKKVGKND